MSRRARPLSPHLSIYRWPITMVLSILHRVTGVALSVGFLLLAAWLLATADGAATYARFAGLAGSLLGRLILIGFSFAFFFHLLNGVRHLIWDLGYGFEIRQMNVSSKVVLAGSVTLTLAFWLAL